MEFISLMRGASVFTMLSVFAVLLMFGQYWLGSMVATSEISDKKMVMLWTALWSGSLTVATGIGMAPVFFQHYHQGMPVSHIMMIFFLILGVVFIPALLIHAAVYYFYHSYVSSYASWIKKSAMARRNFGLMDVLLLLVLLLSVLLDNIHSTYSGFTT